MRMGYHPLVRVHNTRMTYQITPHKSVLNSQNRRLWAITHELLAMYAPLSKRSRREATAVSVRDCDDIWWIVRMSCEGDKRTIGFYLSITETFDEVFKLRLANHEQWRHNTLTACEESATRVEEKDTSVSEIRLLRDNMFSLQTNHAEQTSPIRNLLDVVHQLKDGDTAQIMMRLECVPRVKAKKSMEYSWRIWDKEKVPHRNRFNAAIGVKAVAQRGAELGNQVIGIVEDTVRAVESSFFKGRDGKFEMARIEIADPERQQLLVNGHLSTETRNKQNLPLFKSRVQVVVHCADRVRRDMIAQSIGGAFVEMSGDNRIVCGRSGVGVQECNNMRLTSVDRDPLLLSADEIGKLIQLPTSELQLEYSDEIQSNRRVEIDVPACFRGAGIYMGDVVKKGESVRVTLNTDSKDALFTPRAFVASPRMGKDTAIVNFLVEAKRNHGIGCIILDAIDERGNDRGMADGLRDALDPQDVIDINLSDYDHPVYLGLSGIASTTNQRMAVNRVAQELTSFLMGEDADGRMADYLFACAKAAESDPVLIRSILTHAETRKRMIEQTDDEDTRYLLKDFDGLSVGMQGQIAAPVLVRLSKILRDDFLKPLFGQRPNPTVAWGDWIRDGKSVIVRIPTRDLGPMAVRTLMHWLTMVVFLSKVAGCGGETFVIFNEPHIYESAGWLQFVERMLLEGPKYRIAPIFAFHTFAKISKSLGDTLLASGVNWHIGNNSSVDVFHKLKDVLQPSFTPEEAREQVKKAQFIAAWRDGQGEYQPAFLYDAPDMVSRRYKVRDNSRLTAEHSREFGRPLDEVLADIRMRQRG